MGTRSQSEILLSFFTLSCYSFCDGGDHFCPNSYELEVDLTDRSHQDERLIACQFGRNSPERRCDWRLTVRRLSAPRQLLLETLGGDDGSMSWENSKLELRYQLKQSGNNRLIQRTGGSIGPQNNQIAQPGLFRVLTIHDRQSYISVSWNSASSRKSESSRTVTLRALTPLPAFCSRDMLSFRGNCYAISSIRQTVTAAMLSVQGHAQLASFSSVTEINEFIAANIARESVYPFKRPLNLSAGPLRLGMFIKAAGGTGNVLSIVKNATSCELKWTQADELFKSSPMTGPCGSLTVNRSSGKAAVEFGNCSEPMLVLISFPDTPSGPEHDALDCSRDCSRTVAKTVTELIDGWVDAVDSSWKMPLTIATSVIAGLALTSVLAVLTYLYCGRAVAVSKGQNSDVEADDLEDEIASLTNPQADEKIKS